MDQNIKNAVDRIWAKLELPTAADTVPAPAPAPSSEIIRTQVDRLWASAGLDSKPSVTVSEPVPRVVAKPPISRVIGRVPTRTCVIETCKVEFVPRHPSHDKCVDCARDYFRTLRADERRKEEEAEKIAAARPLTDEQLRQRLIEQYRKGELKEGQDYSKSGAQVTLVGSFHQAGKLVKKSFTYFDHAAAKRIEEDKAAAKRAAANAKSPEQLRKEKLEEARLEAKNLRTSADAAVEKAKSLSDAEAAAKLRAETEDSVEALEAYCLGVDKARKAWNEADSLTAKAQAAEQKLAVLINPPPTESKSAQKKNGKEDKKNGGNGKGRDRHAS